MELLDLGKPEVKDQGFQVQELEDLVEQGQDWEDQEDCQGTGVAMAQEFLDLELRVVMVSAAVSPEEARVPHLVA